MILSHKKENNWKGRGRLSEVFGPTVLWFLGTFLQEISSVNKKYLATHPENSAWTSWVAYTTQRNAELGRYQLRSASRSAVSATCSTWANYLLSRVGLMSWGSVKHTGAMLLPMLGLARPRLAEVSPHPLPALQGGLSSRKLWDGHCFIVHFSKQWLLWMCCGFRASCLT